MKTSIIYHSADFDGIFCREIAHKFIPEANLIGWNFGDSPLSVPKEQFYILDLPLLEPFGLRIEDGWIARDNPIMSKDERQVQPLDRLDWSNWIWIDHHKTSIEKYPPEVPGYRIDGVAACRLAWQWFNRQMEGNPSEPDNSYHAKTHKHDPTCEVTEVEMGDGPIDGCLYLPLPTKQDFIDRKVSEPLAVRLAGEYDVWDRRDPDADLFQYGLRSVKILPDDWTDMLSSGHERFVRAMVNIGITSKSYASHVDAGNMHASFLREWEGLKFLCLNGRGNSLTFASKDMRETGHGALLMFYFQGSQWVVSLYHAKHRTDIDLSEIAKKYGGGGHKGACGFTCDKLPFL